MTYTPPPGHRVGLEFAPQFVVPRTWGELQSGPLIDLIFWPIERDHCRTAFESERNGRHLPEEYRP